MLVTKWSLMVSPRPVPPNRRDMVLSPCANGTNKRSISAALMPIPVSFTVNRSVTAFRLVAALLDRQGDFARGR